MLLSDTHSLINAILRCPWMKNESSQQGYYVKATASNSTGTRSTLVNSHQLRGLIASFSLAVRSSGPIATTCLIQPLSASITLRTAEEADLATKDTPILLQTLAWPACRVIPDWLLVHQGSSTTLHPSVVVSLYYFHVYFTSS
jgi:hypothetical protein